MTIPRFHLTEYGLMLDTPIALTKIQRRAVAAWAEAEYRRRLKTERSDKRDGIVKVIEALRSNNFVERPVPQHDCEQERKIYGT
jgi:hypothetical protein